MKIIKTNEDVNYFKVQREKAELGCYVCPCCGEKKMLLDYIKEEYPGIKGIERHVYFYFKGFFKIKTIYIIEFKCWTCGAKWESEPY